MRTSERGRQRRRLLVEAAGSLLRDEGFAAVTHRAVAARAALPLASTTYYFSSLEQLLVAAVEHLAQGWLEAAQRAVEQLPPQVQDGRELAEALVRIGAVGPAGPGEGDTAVLLTLYERYTEAARSPALRPLIAGYDARIEALLAQVLTRGVRRLGRTGGVPARLVLAVIDGALLRALAEGTDPVAAAVSGVHQLLGFALEWPGPPPAATVGLAARDPGRICS